MNFKKGLNGYALFYSRKAIIDETKLRIDQTKRQVDRKMP